MRTLATAVLLVASPVLAAEVKIQRDVPYAEPQAERRKLDIYAPATGGNHPIVVWIHGGGWRQGDKRAVQQKPQAFVDRGCVFVSINYRFVPDVTVQQMTGDVAKAIRWIHDHAEEHGGNPNMLFVMGHSAGAHLAALVCTDDRYLKAEGLSLSLIKGCVPVDTAAYDIPERFASSPAAKADSGKAIFGADVATQRELSPISYVGKVKSIPPFLILHVADRPDSKAQSERFASALVNAGVGATVVPAAGKTHGTINSELGLPGDKPTKALFEFVDRQLAARSALGQRLNMIGPYGPWLAERVLGDQPARMSFQTGKWKTLDEWRQAGRERTWECMAPVDLGGTPEVRVDVTHEFDGLSVERLSWQLPGGPRSEAVFLKPANAKGRLPAILALHDHGGNKFLGWRKIARIDDQPWSIVAAHQERYYGGVAWANEIAKRGYAVLVHDTFPFASRRVRVGDVPERLRQGGVDPEPNDEEGIKKYNAFAGAHENIMEKSLLSAGTTWPGVYVVEDQRALDVLCARPDVDASRVGCAGLSGGGMRTVFLGGLDDRIRAAVAVGFMTTWREFLLDKCFTHTWMTYVPLLPRDLDFPEILALRAPAATMVLNCEEDPLYTLPEMQRADAMMRDTFARGGAADMYRCNFYPGGHKFDLPMQADAFAWFDRHLKEAK